MEPSDQGDSASSPESTEEYALTLSPTVDTAPGTFEGFEYDAIGRVTAGDDLVVEATAPNHDNYLIEIYNASQLVRGAARPDSDGVVVFDTSDLPPNGYELEPGTFGVAIHHDDDPQDEFRAAHPLVVRAYEMMLETRSTIGSEEELEVTATLDPLPDASTVSIDGAELLVWNENVKYTTEMTAVDGETYTATLTDPPSEDFNCQASVLIPSDAEEVNQESVGVTDKHAVGVITFALAGESVASGVGRPQFATPAVGPDLLFVGGLGSPLHALPNDQIRNDADPAWTVQRAGALSDSSPIIYDGTVYVGSGGGLLYAIDATTGETEWTFDTSEEGTASAITATPAVDPGRQRVYTATNNGTVYAVSLAGEKQWQVNLDGPVYSTVAVGTDRAFVTTASGTLTAIDLNAETIAATTAISDGVEQRGPTIVNGTVYVTGAGVHAFDASGNLDPSATTSWSQTDGLDGAVTSRPCVVDGQVCVGDASGVVHVLAADTGARNWQYETNSPIIATPTEVDGRILVGSQDGSLFLFGSTGELRAATDVSVPIRSSPVVSGSTVYLQSRGVDTAPTDGTVLSLDISRL